MKHSFMTCILTAVLTAASAQGALAQAVSPLAKAASFQAEGQSEQAYLLLASLLEQYIENSDYNYVLGLAASDTGRVTEAIMAFQRTLALQPNNAKARAELARAYAMVGDIDTARDQFNTVVNDPSLPDPVRQRFDSLVRNYDKQISGGGKSVSGFLDVSGGHDSNINAATDDETLVIPLFAAFGAGRLGAAAREQGAEYFNIVGGVSGVAAISRQSRVFGSLLGSYRDNVDSKPFDQAGVTATGGLARTLASRDVISASAQLQQFWLDSKSFRQSYGGVAQYTRRLEGGRALSFSGEYVFQNFKSDPLRDSDRYSGGVSYAGRQFIAGATFGHEETRDNATEHLSFDFYRVNIGAEKHVSSKLSIVANVSGQVRPYDAPDPLFLEKRKDEQLDASIGLKFKITNDLYARPQVTYTRNWSNFALNDYDRFTASLGLRREF